MSKKTYTAKAPFTFTHGHGETSTYKAGDDVPHDVANHWFGKAHVDLGSGKDVSPDDSTQAFIDAEVERRVAIERERIEAEAAERLKELAAANEKSPVTDPVRDEVTEKQAAKDAQTVATGETVKGSTGDAPQQAKDLKAQAEAAGKSTTTGRRGS